MKAILTYVLFPVFMWAVLWIITGFCLRVTWWLFMLGWGVL
jgi:hypothetical protein